MIFDRPRSPRHLIAYLLLALAAMVFALQLRSLYTVPVYDSIRWGGDETWLMREFGNQATHGVMSYPEQYSTPSPSGRGEGVRERTDGALAGNMWVDAMIYGAVGQAFFPSHDLASIGRTITAVLAVILLVSIFFILRWLGVSVMLSAASVAVIVLNQGFVWATHSARYDLLTGLSLLWLVYYFARESEFTRLRSFLLGFIAIAAIIFSRHLLTLGLPVLLVLLIRNRAWWHVKESISIAAGAFSVAVVLALAYWIGAGELSLFGRGGTSGSYGFVLAQIPGLRPFSRNVQLSNLEERFDLFLSDAPSILILIGIAVALVIAYKVWQRRVARQGKRLRIASTNAQQLVIWSAIACGISWLELQGSRPYYLFHIVPLCIVATAIILQLWSEVYEGKWYGENMAVFAMVFTMVFSVGRAIPVRMLGEAIARDQSTAIPKLLSRTERGSRILVDVAGLDRALTDTTRRILTLDMFQPPPVAGDLISKLGSNHIDYVILRSSPVSTPFEPGRAVLPYVLDSIGEVQDSALGFFYDDGRSYSSGLETLISQGLDTLKAYRVHRTVLPY